MIINQITKWANKHNIPIVFNAVGIEGYNIKDPRCQILKKAINRKCIQSISTRDNINSLNNDYIVNKKIETRQVADPALWTKECYNIRKKESNIIGIGVIRPEIFKDYLYDIKEKELLKLFSEIIIKLQAQNYNIKLFTNGVKKDMDFIYKLKDYMKTEKNFEKMIIERPTTTKELVNTIASFKMTIGTRLHSNIISYSLDVPTISIVWNMKQLYFSQLNSIEEFFITKENFNSDYILNKVELIHKQKKLDRKYKNSAYLFIRDIIKKL